MANKGIAIEIDYEKLAKALTDLIDQRIDKRMNETITIKLNGNSNELSKALQTLNNSLKP